MNDISKLLKLPPRILAGLAIASGVLIFSPASIINKLYMTKFKNEYGFILGSTFVVSVSILLCYLSIKVFKHFYDKYRDSRIEKNRLKLLQKLNEDEKELLVEMLRQPSYTMELPMRNGTVIKLNHYKVITPAGSNHLVDPFDMRIPYFVQPWVISMVKKNPNLLTELYGCSH